MSYSPAEACTVRVGVLDAGGNVRRWLTLARARDRRVHGEVDGQVAAGDALTAAPDGTYRFDVERRDKAGNIARLAITVTVDRTLGFPTAVPVTLSPNSDGTRDQTTLGFRLTRRAAVAVAVRLDDKLVRSLALGMLAAGTHTPRGTARPARGVPRQQPADVHGQSDLHARQKQR